MRPLPPAGGRAERLEGVDGVRPRNGRDSRLHHPPFWAAREKRELVPQTQVITSDDIQERWMNWQAWLGSANGGE
jgi:hypothetical protein